jgi:HEAT repeat protein
MRNVSYKLEKGWLGANLKGVNNAHHGEGVGDLKTISSLKGVVSALLMAATVLTFATGVQSQSAADVQNAIGILTDTSNSTQKRISAARDLAVFGQDSNSAAQALIGVLSGDPDPAVRSAAAVALGSAAFPSASPIQALIQALNSDSSPEVRRAAVRGLDVVGVDSDSALQALQSAAQNDPDPGVRQAAQAVYNRFSSN